MLSHWERHVVEHRHGVEEGRHLKYHPERASHGGEVEALELGEVHPVDEELARIRLLQTDQLAHQNGLT